MICLVTDRRRLVGSAASPEAWRRCLIAQARFAAEAGVDLVQVRERDLAAADLAAVVRATRAVVRGTGTRVIVNDRLDVALACGADGVHLRSDSISASDVRRIAPRGLLIGRSIHSIGEAMSASGIDYLIAGTVFPSPSKPDATALVGVDGLRAIVQAVRVPVLAIGGVTEARVDAIAQAGAAGCAAIGLFMSEAGGSECETCRAMPLYDRVARVRQRFDTVKTAS